MYVWGCIYIWYQSLFPSTVRHSPSISLEVAADSVTGCRERVSSCDSVDRWSSVCGVALRDSSFYITSQGLLITGLIRLHHQIPDSRGLSPSPQGSSAV